MADNIHELIRLNMECISSEILNSIKHNKFNLIAKLPEDGSNDGTGSGSFSGSGSIVGREGFSESKLTASSTQKDKNGKSKIDLSSSGSTSPENRESTKKTNSEEEKGESGDVSESEEDIEPVEVLLQFIPYYGQGDPSNDR